LENIARALVDALSHRELSTLLKECGIDEQGGGPRWERLLLSLSARQERDGCGNNVGAAIQAILQPSRFAGRRELHLSLLETVNRFLAFDGLHVGETGDLRAVPRATTVSEAEARASRLREELIQRKVHSDVLAFCRAELLEDNYFHAVLEAAKSVAEKVRQRTGLGSDGAELATAAFGGAQPRLALNSLRTETEKSEQRGFVNLLLGFFGTFRNPPAHAPKIMWPIQEQDAFDLLTMASYLHRRIDAAAIPRWGTGGVA
jgi:uncharacterized protein (TIGR02391 family)